MSFVHRNRRGTNAFARKLHDLSNLSDFSDLPCRSNWKYHKGSLHGELSTWIVLSTESNITSFHFINTIFASIKIYSRKCAYPSRTLKRSVNVIAWSTLSRPWCPWLPNDIINLAACVCVFVINRDEGYCARWQWRKSQLQTVSFIYTPSHLQRYGWAVSAL